MDRRSFLAGSLPALVGATNNSGEASNAQGPKIRLRNIQRPLAITMWDFSWLERRWPGAGYEDWDLALDGLALRGYDAVRIDAGRPLRARQGAGFAAGLDEADGQHPAQRPGPDHTRLAMPGCRHGRSHLRKKGPQLRA